MNNEKKSEQIRSFIAVELPDKVKDGLGRIQSTLKSDDPNCTKWVDPQSIHLTLKFLGNIDVNRIDAITGAMQDTAALFDEFRLQIGGLGAFPNLRRVQVIWVGIKGDIERLLALQKNLDTKLAKLGYLPEKRAFVPHLTLARVRDYASPAERLALGELITGTRENLMFNVAVTSLSLMRSQLNPKGAIYSQLRSVELQKSN
jgi:RNA 2',3'-cyclic 3'-phosphodiesterase